MAINYQHDVRPRGSKSLGCKSPSRDGSAERRSGSTMRPLVAYLCAVIAITAGCMSILTTTIVGSGRLNACVGLSDGSLFVEWASRPQLLLGNHNAVLCTCVWNPGCDKWASLLWPDVVIGDAATGVASLAIPAWCVVAPLLIPVSRRLRRSCVLRSRVRDGRCTTCGYQWPPGPDECCPECGCGRSGPGGSTRPGA